MYLGCCKFLSRSISSVITIWGVFAWVSDDFYSDRGRNNLKNGELKQTGVAGLGGHGKGRVRWALHWGIHQGMAVLFAAS